MNDYRKLALIGDCISAATDAKDLARRLAEVLELKSEATRMIDAFAALVHERAYAGVVQEGTYRVDRIDGDDGAVLISAEFIPHGDDNEAPETGPALQPRADAPLDPAALPIPPVPSDGDRPQVVSREDTGPSADDIHASTRLPDRPLTDGARVLLAAQAAPSVARALDEAEDRTAA